MTDLLSRVKAVGDKPRKPKVGGLLERVKAVGQQPPTAAPVQQVRTPAPAPNQVTTPQPAPQFSDYYQPQIDLGPSQRSMVRPDTPNRPLPTTPGLVAELPEIASMAGQRLLSSALSAGQAGLAAVPKVAPQTMTGFNAPAISRATGLTDLAQGSRMAEQQIGAGIQSGNTPYSPAWFARQIVESAPQMLAVVAAGIPTGGVGAFSMGALLEGGNIASDVYQREIAAGASEQQASERAFIAMSTYGPIAGVLEKIGVGPILKGGVGRVGRAIISEGITEPTQGAAQEFTTAGVTGQPIQPGFFSRRAQELAAGAATGGVVSAVTPNLANQPQRSSGDPRTRTAPAPTQTVPTAQAPAGLPQPAVQTTASQSVRQPQARPIVPASAGTVAPPLLARVKQVSRPTSPTGRPIVPQESQAAPPLSMRRRTGSGSATPTVDSGQASRPLSDLTYRELKDRAKAAGLDSRGTKAVLVERLSAASATLQADRQTQPGETPPTHAESAPARTPSPRPTESQTADQRPTRGSVPKSPSPDSTRSPSGEGEAQRIRTRIAALERQLSHDNAAFANEQARRPGSARAEGIAADSRQRTQELAGLRFRLSAIESQSSPTTPPPAKAGQSAKSGNLYAGGKEILSAGLAAGEYMTRAKRVADANPALRDKAAQLFDEINTGKIGPDDARRRIEELESTPLPPEVEASKAEPKGKEPWEMTDKELSAEDKRASAALNRWANATPGIIQKGEDYYVNPALHSPEGHELSERVRAISDEQDVRKSGVRLTQQQYFDRWLNATISKKDRAEFLSDKKRVASVREQTDRNHRRTVEHALSQGKPVPPEVLADYPDLKSPVESETGTSKSPLRAKQEETAAAKVKPLLDQGWTPVAIEVDDPAAKRAAERELHSLRDYPIGNPDHPDTIRYRELKARLAQPFTTTAYKMKAPDGNRLRPISKTDYEVAVAQRKEAIPSESQAQGKEPKGKEPWEMTKAELEAAAGKKVTSPHDLPFGAHNLRLAQIESLVGKGTSWTTAPAGMQSWHRAAVASALRDRLPVPPEVLADYPDLSKQAELARIANNTKRIGDTRPPQVDIEAPRDLRGFDADMSPMERGKAAAALSRTLGNRGRVVPRQQIVDEMVDAGATIVEAANGERRLTKPDGVYLTDKQLGSIAFDYAAHRLKSPLESETGKGKGTEYTIRPARYAKGKMIIESPSDGSGFKTRAHRLAVHVGGKWVNREKGYNVSAAQAKRFEKLFAEGRDASAVTGDLEEPDSIEEPEGRGFAAQVQRIEAEKSAVKKEGTEGEQTEAFPEGLPGLEAEAKAADALDREIAPFRARHDGEWTQEMTLETRAELDKARQAGRAAAKKYNAEADSPSEAREFVDSALNDVDIYSDDPNEDLYMAEAMREFKKTARSDDEMDGVIREKKEKADQEQRQIERVGQNTAAVLPIPSRPPQIKYAWRGSAVSSGAWLTDGRALVLRAVVAGKKAVMNRLLKTADGSVMRNLRQGLTAAEVKGIAEQQIEAATVPVTPVGFMEADHSHWQNHTAVVVLASDDNSTVYRVPADAFIFLRDATEADNFLAPTVEKRAIVMRKGKKVVAALMPTQDSREIDIPLARRLGEPRVPFIQSDPANRKGKGLPDEKLTKEFLDAAKPSVWGREARARGIKFKNLEDAKAKLLEHLGHTPKMASPFSPAASEWLRVGGANPDTAKIVEAPENKADKRIAEVAQSKGLKVVYVDAGKKLEAPAVIDGDTIYIDVHQTAGAKRVGLAYHELVHAAPRSDIEAITQSIKDLDPEGWQRARDWYQSWYSSIGKTASDERLDEEATATMAQQVSAYLALAEDSPAKLIRLATAQPTAIKKFIDLFQKALRRVGLFQGKTLLEKQGERLTPARIAIVLRGLVRRMKAVMPDTAKFAPAYHGSPHDFDKFTTAKIGTGEGAQAYGWGMYFAGNKEVAEHYRNVLAAKDDVYVDGKRLDNQYGFVAAAIRNALAYKDRVKGLRDTLEDYENRLARTEANDARDMAIGNARALQMVRESDAPELREAITTLKALDLAAVETRKGRLYAVDLKPAEDEYLLWDKPLSEQSEKVKAAIRTLQDAVPDDQQFSVYGRHLNATAEGNDVYHAVTYERMHWAQNEKANGRYIGDSPEQLASAYLRSLGIRGIKYLDGSSRQSKVTQNTETGKWFVTGSATAYDTRERAERAADEDRNYNYVIFDDADVEVTGKYAAPEMPKSERETADKALHEKAVKHFGVTQDPREAGYVLPDGRMLDFTGRHAAVGYTKTDRGNVPKSGQPDYLAGTRNIDHREIAEIGASVMSDFTDSGAARVDFRSGIVDLSKPMTAPQLHQIARGLYGYKHEVIQIDATNPMTREGDAFTADGLSMRKIKEALNAANEFMGFLDAKFAAPEGEKPIGRPDLSQGKVKGEAQRRLVDAVDEARKPHTPRSRKTVESEADARMEKDSDGEWASIVGKVHRGELLTDTETVIAMNTAAKKVNDAIRTGDAKDFFDAAVVLDTYRQSGTEQARALSIRYDRDLSPAERNERALANLLAGVDQATAKRAAQMRSKMQAIRGEIDSIAQRELKPTKFHDRPVQIIRDYVARIKAIRARMAELKAGAAPKFAAPEDSGEWKALQAEMDQIVEALGGQKDAAEIEKLLDSLDKKPIVKAKQTEVQRIEQSYNKMMERHSEQAVKVRDSLFGLGIDPRTITDEMIGDPATAARIARAVSTAKASTVDKWLEFYYNSILSGPKTFIANTLGAGFGAYEMFGKRAVEAGINLLSPGRSTDIDSARFGDYNAMRKHAARSFARAGRSFVRAFRDETPVLGEEIARAGGEASNRTLIDRPVKQAIEGTQGRVIRIPTRIMLATDEFWKGLYGELDASARAYRVAKAEGLKGKAAWDRVDELIADMASPAWEKAHETAQRLAFQSEPGKLTKGIIKLRDDFWPLNFVIPFVNTPVNIAKRATGLTPLSAVRFVAKGANTAYARMSGNGSTWTYNRQTIIPDAAGAIISLGLVAAIATAMFDEDDQPRITGSRERSDGLPKTSVRIAGQWYNYNRIEPFATALAFMADSIDSARMAGDATAALGSALSTASGVMLDKTFMTGLADLMDAIDNYSESGMTSAALKWASNFAAGWVPNIIRQTASSLDPNIRDTAIRRSDEMGLLESAAWTTAQRALPFVIAPPPPRYDVWGQPMRTDTGPASNFMWRLLVPVNVREQEEVPARLSRIIAEWNAQPGNDDAQWYPKPPSNRFSRGGKVYRLEKDDYQRMLKESGQAAVARLGKMNLKADQDSIDRINEELSDARSDWRDQWIKDQGGASSSRPKQPARPRLPERPRRR